MSNQDRPIDRARLWAKTLMDTLARADEPMSVSQAYRDGILRLHVPKKTLQRALQQQETPTGDCLIRRTVRFPGVSGSYSLLWTRVRWRAWKASTWLAVEPRNPSALRARLLRTVVRKSGIVSRAPWLECYTCEGCGQERYRAPSSRRRTCSSPCRQRAYRARLGRRVTPLLDTCHTSGGQ